MSIGLLHPLLAVAAMATIVVPIAIHLLFRQKPKPVIFPALMLLKPKQRQTTRRLQLKHWLLLLLRCLALLMLGLALARPTFRSGLFSFDQQGPIVAAFVIDDSASMSFLEKGISRLEQAKQMAREAIHRMPEQSQFLLITTTSPVESALLERAAALARLDAIEVQPLASTLNEALATGLRGLAQATQERKELYLFTDSAEGAWNLRDESAMMDLIEGVGGSVTTYLVDVQAEKLVDLGIEKVEVSPVASSADRTLTVHIRGLGEIQENTLRVTLDGEARGEKPIRLDAGQSVRVEFPLPSLKAGAHGGVVSLARGDSYAYNDTYFFTVTMSDPPRVLIVSGNPRESRFWLNAIAPPGELGTVPRESIEQISSVDLSAARLENFDVVCLLNVPTLLASDWNALAKFTDRGKGIFLGLGENVSVSDYNTPAAQEVIPGKLETIVQSENARLAPASLTGDLLAPFQEWGGTDFPDWPVNKYWKVTPADKASVVIPFSDGSAGLVESFSGKGGRGRVILWTTSVSYEPDGEAWSEVPLGWSFVMLADRIIHVLSGSSSSPLSYITGDTVEVNRRPFESNLVYAISGPEEMVERVTVDPSASSVAIPNVRLPGSYRVDSQGEESGTSELFAVNAPSSEGVFQPVPLEMIQRMLGEKNPIEYVRDPGSLKRVEGNSRVGRELFPWMILLVGMLICLEGYFANRFYRRKSAPFLHREGQSASRVA